jgi:hypothetical protein
MSRFKEELSLDLVEAGLSTEQLSGVSAKITVLSGLKRALDLQEEEVHDAVRNQDHILEAPQGKTFVVKRMSAFAKPSDPPVEVGFYSLGTRDRSELVGLFEQPSIAAQDAQPFFASRLEVSQGGIMAVNGEDYRIVEFGIDKVEVSSPPPIPTEP